MPRDPPEIPPPKRPLVGQPRLGLAAMAGDKRRAQAGCRYTNVSEFHVSEHEMNSLQPYRGPAEIAEIDFGSQSLATNQIARFPTPN
jgi:hypothetical protein